VLILWALGSLHVPALGPLPAFSVGLGVAVNGSPLLAFLVVVLLAVGAVSLGIFLSTFARTELQVIQFIPIVLAPQFLLSGVLFPVSTLPSILQPLVAIMPLNYAVDGLRQVFIRGADLGVAALQLDLVVLAVVAASSRRSRPSRFAATSFERPGPRRTRPCPLAPGPIERPPDRAESVYWRAGFRARIDRTRTGRSPGRVDMGVGR